MADYQLNPQTIANIDTMLSDLTEKIALLYDETPKGAKCAEIEAVKDSLEELAGTMEDFFTIYFYYNNPKEV